MEEGNYITQVDTVVAIKLKKPYIFCADTNETGIIISAYEKVYSKHPAKQTICVPSISFALTTETTTLHVQTSEDH